MTACIPNPFGTFVPAARGKINASLGGLSVGVFRLPTDPWGSATLSFAGLVSGTDITVLLHGTETILHNAEDIEGTTYDYTYEYFAETQWVDITLYRPGYMPAYIINYPLGRVNVTLPEIKQTPDASYLE